IGVFFGFFDGDYSKPKMFAAHWIMRRLDQAIIMADRLPGPANAPRLGRQVDVDKGRGSLCYQKIQHLCDIWLDGFKIYFFSGARGTECDSFNTEKSGLLGCG